MKSNTLSAGMASASSLAKNAHCGVFGHMLFPQESVTFHSGQLALLDKKTFRLLNYLTFIFFIESVFVELPPQIICYI